MVKTDYKYELYFGNDIKLTDNITIHQPTIRNIFEYEPHNNLSNTEEQTNDSDKAFECGEQGFLKMIALLTVSPADYDVQLEDAGVRYEDVDKLDFFFSIIHMYNLSSDLTYPIFGDLNLMAFERFEDSEKKSIVYVNPDGIRIDKLFYEYLIGIIRTMFNLSENKTTWKNETSRQMHFDIERKRLKHKHHKQDKQILIPIISMLINLPGFKYDREHILDLNIYFFYDCLKQSMHYSQVDHLMTGVYVGLIDTKKMNLEESLNMIRNDIQAEENPLSIILHKFTEVNNYG